MTLLGQAGRGRSLSISPTPVLLSLCCFLLSASCFLLPVSPPLRPGPFASFSQRPEPRSTLIDALSPPVPPQDHVGPMYSSGLILLLLICLIHTQSIAALVDTATTISVPHVVPLDIQQPGIRRREVLKALRQRQGASQGSSCPADFNQCGKHLPSDFCCRSTDACIPLAKNTAVLCCPNGGTCSSIQPITCSVAVQNATAYPTSSLHSTNLDGTLPVCGRDSSGSNTCCPFGYSCNENSICILTQTETPVSTGILSTATSDVASGPTVTDSDGTTITSSTPESTYTVIMPTYVPPSDRGGSSSDSPSSPNRPKTIGIATGSAVGGVAAVAGILVFAWVKRRRIRETTRQKQEQSAQRNSATPPPLPPKEFPYPPPKKKRTSIIPSWAPSFINKTTPVELPASPVSFSAWNNQWDSVQPPNRAHRPYPRDSMSPPIAYELDSEARWLPQPDRHQRGPMYF